MGTPLRLLSGLLALAVAAPVWAERQWTDSRGAQWPSSVASCVQGEAETRLGELRRASPTIPYRYSSLVVNEWDPGYESICRFVIERRLGYGWVTAEIHDHANYGGGQNDPCPRGGVDETGACMRKSAGAPACPGNGSNPINGGTANKYQREVDYRGPGGNPLLFARHYNHLSTEAGPLGALWRHDYQRRILVVAVSGNQASAVKVYRADGRRYAFTLASGAWRSDADVVDRLAQRFDATGTPAGWTYTDSSDAVETYDAEGRLIALAPRGALTQTLTYDTNGQLHSVDDGYGHRLLLAYLDTGASGNGRYRLATLTDPAGKLLRYGYDAAGNLATVTYPDGRVRTYHYNEPLYTGGANLPHALTGITGENGVRFATYRYDGLARAIGSEHAGGANRVTLVYNLDGSATATDALGTARTYGFQTILGVTKNTAVSQPCASCGGATALTTYDANGNVRSRTDFNGNLTCYAYDPARNLETVRIEGFAPGSSCPANLAGYTPAANSAQRKISTEWHPTWRVVKRRAEPKRLTTFVWGNSAAQCGAAGSVCQETVQATTDANGGQGFAATLSGAPRAWAYTYNGRGQILTANGPRTDVNDVTAYTYYADDHAVANNRKQLRTVTDALNHATVYSNYDAHGRARRSTDANGVVTDGVYDTRGRLTSIAVAGRLTTVQYNSAGLLWKVTPPDQGAIVYGYDAAHRLRNITNGAGEKIVYSLDGLGNRTKEQHFAAGAAIASTTLNRRFDALGRLWKQLNAANEEMEVLTYDAQGNLDTRTDKPDDDPAHDQLTDYSLYDARNRLRTVTDALGGVTRFAYDGRDRLIQVKDPRLNATSYSISGLDNQSQEISPDRGTLKNTLFDTAGNVKTALDARNNGTQYTYDALNRLFSETFADGTSVDYEYDIGTGAVGRIDRIDDSTGHTDYRYDSEGRLSRKEQTTGTLLRAIDYGYDPATGRLERMTYPSGASVSYGYDSAGRIQSLTLTTETLPATAIVANVIYQPLGPVKSYQLPAVSGAPIIARGYDSNGRVASYTLIESIGGVPTLVAKTLRYDRLGNLTVLGDPGTTANDRTYGYDKLNRLTDLGAPGLAHRYVYDAAGNRTLRTINGVTTGYTPQIASNRLAAVGGVNYLHDASGNITDNGPTTFHYDAKGRLHSATTAANVVYTYGINGPGQRVTKTSPALPGGRVYVYDEAGHLAGEYTNSGARIQEHIWLGDVPVAVISGGGAVFHVLSDHLGTPRQILDSAKRLRWRWDNTDPFGVNAPNQNPQGLGGFGYNLRFPGQYYDAESGLHYNYFRDYDPRVGRYVQSDPIGLEGGINLYSYVNGNPLSYTDPLGLYPGEEYVDATRDFGRNYRDMRDANTKGADKYFHCKANCEAAQRGKDGEQMACLISDGREWFDQNIKRDPASASAADQAANQYGRSQGAGSSQACSQLCAPHRPNGLPARY